MIHREIAGNVEKFFSIDERVGVVVIKLHKPMHQQLPSSIRP